MAIRRRKPRFFDEFFGDLDEEIRELEENVFRIFEETQGISIKTDENKPRFYGFSMYIGLDGIPQVEKFGDVSETGDSKIPQSSQDYELLSEVIEGESEISIITEMPGIDKNDIKLNAGEDKIEINVTTKGHEFHRTLNLPCKVKPETTKATYKNGVLGIKIGRAEKKAKGIDVRVE